MAPQGKGTRSKPTPGKATPAKANPPKATLAPAEAAPVKVVQKLNFPQSTKLDPDTAQRSPRVSRPRGPRPKFHKFPKLPPELRYMIWRFTWKPRLIRATYRAQESGTSGGINKQIYKLCAGPLPSALHVCKDSRHEALKHYRPIKSRSCFSGEDEAHDTYIDHVIFVNFDLDTLYFTNIPTTPGLLSWLRYVMKIPKAETQNQDRVLQLEKCDKSKTEAKSETTLPVQQVQFESIFGNNFTPNTMSAKNNILPKNCSASSFSSSASPSMTGFIPQSRRPLYFIAFSQHAFSSLIWLGKQHLLYSLIRQTQTLKSITVVFDNAVRFQEIQNPHHYSFTNITKPRLASKSRGIRPIAEITERFMQLAMNLEAGPTWKSTQNPTDLQKKELEAWTKWRAGKGKRHPFPRFEVKGLNNLKKGVM